MELPAVRTAPVQDAGLDRGRLDRSALGSAQHLDGHPHRGGEVPALLESILELLHEVLGVPPDRDEPVFVRHASVEQHVVEGGARGAAVDLAHEDLDLVGLHLLGEDVRQRL